MEAAVFTSVKVSLAACLSSAARAVPWHSPGRDLSAAVTFAARRKGDFHLVLNYDIILLDL